MTSDNNVRAQRYLVALCLIVSLFFLWGIANSLNDILIKQFKKVFVLSDFRSGLVQSAFYLGYFFLAIPASMMIRRFGYKAAVVLGLVLYGAGALLFYPAAEIQEYGFFLFALFVIASGLAFLETSANPLMLVLGPPKGAAFRINLAQAFNPLGTISAIFIGRNFILSGNEPTTAQLAAMPSATLHAFYTAEAHAVQTPYLVLGAVVLLWALFVLLTKFPRAAEAEEKSGTDVSRFRDLFKHRHFLFGVAAQFFYVGAQVGIWSFLIRYSQFATHVGEKTAADFLLYSQIAFLVGRFAGTALMGVFSPALLMALFSLINVVLALVAVFVGGYTGMIALVAASFFMSVMFPTIFALALNDLGPLAKQGSSFVVMGIIGGALFPALMGEISDLSKINIAMLVPAICFVVVGLFAMASRRGSEAALARV